MEVSPLAQSKMRKLTGDNAPAAIRRAKTHYSAASPQTGEKAVSLMPKEAVVARRLKRPGSLLL